MIIVYQRYSGQTDRQSDNIRWREPPMQYHGAGKNRVP